MLLIFRNKTLLPLAAAQLANDSQIPNARPWPLHGAAVARSTPQGGSARRTNRLTLSNKARHSRHTLRATRCPIGGLVVTPARFGRLSCPARQGGEEIRWVRPANL